MNKKLNDISSCRTENRFIKLVFASYCMAAAVTGCQQKSAPESVVPVKIKELQPQKISFSSRFSGSIEPFQTTALAFKLAGTVRSVYRPQNLNRDVQVGDTLSKGIVIADLDEGDLQRKKESAETQVALLEARVSTARDNLEIARRNYERFASSGGSVSRTARDDVDARRVTAAGELAAAGQALIDARVHLNQATDDLLNRQLLVPFDRATVAEKHLEPGERVQSGNTVFKLIDISTVRVRFGIPDTMIGEAEQTNIVSDRVYLGQKLQITSDAFSGRVMEGEVTKISPQADPRTRTFLTELTLPNKQLPDGQPLLRAGMIVTVQVGAENNRHALLVPMAALHRGGTANDLIVYEASLKNNREVAKARKVSVGGVYDNQVEILPDKSEVRAGSKVILTTAERLSESQPIRIELESNVPQA